MGTNAKKTTIEHITDVKTIKTKNSKLISHLSSQHDKEFVICANDFWYVANNFIITFDEENECIRPFPNFPYLHNVHDKVENNQKVIVLKSRRLLITWYSVARHWWRMKFAGTGAILGKDVFFGALMSIGEKEAEGLIKRVRFIENHMPLWIKDRNPIVKDNQLYLEFQKGGNTTAFPLKRDGPRSFGFSEVFFDEMAFMEAVRGVWTGMMPTLGAKSNLIAVSTPNGPSNLFSEIWNNKNGRYPDEDICRIQIECDENPEHGDEWYEKAIKGMDKRMIAREFGLSFSTPAGEPVWDLYEKSTHVADKAIEPMVGKPLLIGYDLGYHFPAITVWQHNSQDQYVGLWEYEDFDKDFGEFCRELLIFLNSVCEFNSFRVIHCVPPDGKMTYHSKSQSGAINDVGEIRNVFGKNAQIRFGAMETGTRDNEGPRLKEIRKLWGLRQDKRCGIVISPEMPQFIEGCQAGYCYPEKGGEVPEKNEASHLQDSAQAVVTAFNRLSKSNRGDEKNLRYEKTKRKYSKFRTGF